MAQKPYPGIYQGRGHEHPQYLVVNTTSNPRLIKQESQT